MADVLADPTPQIFCEGRATARPSHTIWWEALTNQVIRRVGSPRTDAQQLMAAVLDGPPEAVASHLTAARWWGHNGCTLRPFVTTTASRSRRDSSLGVMHRITDLPDEFTTRLDGVPIVRPQLLAMHLFDVCRYERAERLVEWLWSHRLLSGPSIHRFREEFGERGRIGSTGLREYLRDRPPDYVPAASGIDDLAQRQHRPKKTARVALRRDPRRRIPGHRP